MARNRFYYTLTLFIVVMLGLMSRRYALYLPAQVNLILGDAIWASMIFVLAAILLSKSSTLSIATMSLAFCFIIEVTQLYHAPWIDSIRATRLGGLVLGFGFLWSDIVAYTIGTAAAAFADYVVRRRAAK